MAQDTEPTIDLSDETTGDDDPAEQFRVVARQTKNAAPGTRTSRTFSMFGAKFGLDITKLTYDHLHVEVRTLEGTALVAEEIDLETHDSVAYALAQMVGEAAEVYLKMGGLGDLLSGKAH